MNVSGDDMDIWLANGIDDVDGLQVVARDRLTLIAVSGFCFIRSID
jgi:hypothetical protein